MRLTAWLAAAGLMLAALCVARAVGTQGAQLRQSPGTPAPPELVQKMMAANAFWLHPPVAKLWYTYEMGPPGSRAKWSATVEFNAPGHLSIQCVGGDAFAGKIDDSYDRENLAYPPRLTTVLQGTTFWGPVHELAKSPNDYKLELVGEDTIDGKPATILHPTPVWKPATREATGANETSERERQRLEPDQPPEPYLSMRVGCGIWGAWYGYSGVGSKVDQVWVDKATGMVLREEGFTDGKAGFLVEYGDFEDVGQSRQAPRHVVITLLGDGEEYPWVFDLHFTTMGGRCWLMDTLEESTPGAGVDAKAHTSEVTVEPTRPGG